MPSPARVGSKEAQAAAHRATAGPPPSSLWARPPDTPHVAQHLRSPIPVPMPLTQPSATLSPTPSPTLSAIQKPALSSFAKDMLLNLGRFC